MITFAQKYGRNVYSQFGEDLLIEECLNRIKPELKFAVEFGGHDGTFCSNTAYLRDQGWRVDMYDINPGSKLVMKLEIRTDNINLAVRPCSVLSMDTDGPDYELWKAYDYTPDIVIIEINSSLPPMKEHYQRENGASYITMLKLGILKGYFLVCHTGNMIFVLNKHRELFPEIIGSGIENYTEYFNTSHQ